MYTVPVLTNHVWVSVKRSQELSCRGELNKRAALLAVDVEVGDLSKSTESRLESIGSDARRHRWDVAFGANPGRDRIGSCRTLNGARSFNNSNLNSSSISIRLEMSSGYAASYLSRCFICGIHGEGGGVAAASMEELACNDMAFDKS